MSMGSIGSTGSVGSIGSTGSGGAADSIDSRHSTTPRASRMDHVQAPIIPVVGAWIRETPGTISLGQGVVHYGPPPESLDAVRAALAQPSTHEYNDGAGIPPLVAAIRKKLAAENHIDVNHGSRIMVTAG